MKKKVFIILIVVLLALLGYGACRYFLQPDGSTVESREKILEGTPKGIEWNISQEQEFKNYLLCGIYSENKSGIAVFEAIGNGKYKLASIEWRNTDEIVISGFSVDGEWYDLIWFNGAKTDYAEIFYEVSGENKEPVIFDVSDMKIICTKAPGKDYTMSVRYYDNNGDMYE